MESEPPADIELELVESADGVDDAQANAVLSSGSALEFSFSAELWYWRGPAPYHFLTVSPDAARAIHSVAANVTYGWGMIPARVVIGSSDWETALWPKDGGYVVPIKDRFRKAEGLGLGDGVAVRLVIRR
jgi:Domain of unknown function (DUF1905)